MTWFVRRIYFDTDGITSTLNYIGLFDGFTSTNYFDLLICSTDWLVRQIGVPELLRLLDLFDGLVSK